MIRTTLDRWQLKPLLGRASDLCSKFLFNASGTVIGQLVQMVAVPLQLHALGAEQFGVLILFSSFVMAGSIVDAGIGPTTLRFVARSDTRPKLLEQVLASSRSIVLLISLAIFVTSQIISLVIVSMRGSDLLAGTSIHFMAALIAIGIMLSMMTTVGINTLRGLRRYAFFATFDTASRILQPLILVGLALATRSVTIVLIGNCVAMGVFAILVTILSTREARVRMRLTTNLRYFRRHMSRFSIWIWWQAIFGYLGSQADRLVVASFMSLSMLSMYAIALQLANTIVTIVSAAGGFLMPEAANRLRDAQWLLKTYWRFTLFFSATSAVGIIVIAPMAPTLLQLWLGQTHGMQVLPFLLPLLWVASSTVSSIPGTQLMNAMGYVRFGALVGMINNSVVLSAMVVGGWRLALSAL